MSDYFNSLDNTSKRRYREKLESVGVANVTEEDPFLWRNESDGYSDNIDGICGIIRDNHKFRKDTSPVNEMIRKCIYFPKFPSMRMQIKS